MGWLVQIERNEIMKMTVCVGSVLCAVSLAGSAMAQGNASVPPQHPASATAHEPPAQAYTDCKGKKAGDAVEHTTREGIVAATCESTPNGLVARPKQPRPETGATTTK
jgi:hypothetical protein